MSEDKRGNLLYQIIGDDICSSPGKIENEFAGHFTGQGGWYNAGLPEGLRAKSLKDLIDTPYMTSHNVSMNDENPLNEIRGPWAAEYFRIEDI